VAKIAGIKLCESYNRQHGTDFRSVMPTNLYGPEDNFDLAGGRLASLGWRPSIPLRQGIRETCEWYRSRLRERS
jgi:nucleoside-diphosphate-sugar epimerase